NVLQTLRDWSARRESMTLHTGMTLVAFSERATRDAWLEGKKGTACGEHCVLLPPGAPAIRGLGLRVDHERGQRRTLLLDEEGLVRAEAPLDMVQRARLERLADPEGDAWRLTAESIHRAARAGLKGGWIEAWLVDHLSEPMPPLLGFALQAWS